MSDVTQILNAIAQGGAHAADDLIPVVYGELRRLAAQKIAREKPGLTIQPTALVHEAYLRLVGDPSDRRWDNRGHFFAAAAEAMRRILVENSRRKHCQKQGGGRHRQELDEARLVLPEPTEDLLALDEALDRLAQVDRSKCELVKLRYFAGLTIEEAARALSISPATAKRHWTYARAWLFREMSK
jgi:RNA polymerase sigma factor (TIGR02999 family)